MSVEEEKHTRYAMGRVLRYIEQVEASYDVSIKFWIDFIPDGHSSATARVHSIGSGSIFDLIPTGLRSPASEVHDDEPYALGEAVYYSVLFWANYFHRVREPLGGHPYL